MSYDSTPEPYPPSWPPQSPATPGDWIWSALSNTWEWVGDQQAVLVAIAAIVTAFVAIFALRSTARDSRERARPIVLAYFRKSPNNESAFDLVIHNFGTSAAVDIEVRFTPPFGTSEREDHMAEALAQRYDKPVPLMPPGAEITNVWWALDFTAPDGSGKNRYPMPDEAVASISYKGNRLRRYKDTIKLDTNWMKGDTTTTSSSSPPGLAKRNADSLKKIAEEARAMRLLLRDISVVLDSPGKPDEPGETLAALVAASGSDIGGLASRLGISIVQAAEIVSIVEREQVSNKVDVVSNGQIMPAAGFQQSPR